MSGRPLLFWLMNLLLINALRGQSPVMHAAGFTVEHIGLKEGLPAADIRTLLRDKTGFLWLGTTTGLVQYDGFVCKSISLTDNGEPIGQVNALLEDPDGTLWVGTEEGLFRYDDGKVSALPAIRQPTLVRINALLFDKRHTLWIGCGSGVYHLSPAQQQQLKKRPAQATAPRLLTGYDRLTPKARDRRVFALALDEEGSLYVGGKMDLFRYRNGRLTRIWQSPAGQKTEIQAIAVRSENDLLFSAHDQFCYIRLRNGRPETLLQGLVPSDVLLDGQRYWLLSYGLKQLDAEAQTPWQQLNLYHHTSSQFNKLLLDREGTFWVATNEGLLKIRRSAFDRIPLPAAVAGNEINGFGLYNGQLVFGAHHGRLFRLGADQVSPLLTDLVPIAGIAGIQQDRRGVLWMATTYQGLLAYDGRRTRHYTRKDGLSDEGFNDLIPTAAGDLWAVGDVGLTQIRFDALKQAYTFTFFEHSTNRYRFTIFYNGFEAPDHTLWLASDAGLISFRNGQFTSHPIQWQGQQVRSVQRIIRDRQGTVWLATDGQGLIRGNLSGQQFSVTRQYTTADGLSANYLLDVYADSDGNIWTGSAIALHCLTPAGLRTFSFSDGFFSESYQSMHLFEYPRGTLYVGTTAGLLRFSVSQLRQRPVAAPLTITGLRLPDSRADLWQFTTGRDPSGLPEQLRLPPEQNALTFGFSLMSLVNTPYHRYRFRLLGAEAGWRPAQGTERSVTYAGLAPGRYTFQVEGMTAAGSRSGLTAFSFEVLPPVWQRWWFLTGAAMLLLGVVAGYFTRRERTLRHRQAEKVRIARLIAELETRAIRSQMNPHFIFNCLNAIQECILADDTDTAYRYLSKFSRLLRMVLEESTRSMHALQQEIDVLRLYLDLEALRFGSSFAYTLRVDADLDPALYQVPALLLQPLTENAIRHGLLHKTGLRQLDISLRIADGHLHCLLEDNGVGREQAAAFSNRSAVYRRKTSKGLALTNERLALLEKSGLGKASMHIDDLVSTDGTPIGTRISIRLPLITAFDTGFTHTP
ncbi:sensor histidine kinase [Arsenicibacter rosenii]|uniref:Uncharacterized protein n=1 Tax=Arsenicibacter rosenii TaxID=1750698 RepID=A0A1S2VBL6_9BACT|nr:sensor histidine kinase [Arsenicibacter rosenii]OIN56082.1 hypothetical protein BLX24_26865 [Arsenicibacter rosenii]